MPDITKEYSIELMDDLSGWKRVYVRVDVISTGTKERLVKLKDDFEIMDAVGTSLPAISRDFVSVTEKKVINQGASVEFYMTINSSVDWKVFKDKPEFLIDVKVKLDLSAMAQAAGNIMAGMMGMGMLGGVIGASVPQEMGILTGTCRVKAQVPKFSVVFSKPRWDMLQIKDLMEYVPKEEIVNLYRSGGELWIPVKVKELQTTGEMTVKFDRGLPVCDVQAELDWMGLKIRGEHKDGEDPKRENVIFIIPAKISGSTPTPSMGASDLANGIVWQS